MNSPIIMPGLPTLSESQQACVDLLRESLEQAEAGNIYTIGIIACMETGYASVMAGSRASDLNFGCDSLKRKILDAVEGGNVKRPSIVRPK